MSTIKGYRVRMWTSDESAGTDKFLENENLLQARRDAFQHAENLRNVMEEAKKAGVINYHDPEVILSPEVKLEDVVLGNVQVSVVYEERRGELLLTDEDLIYVAVANEGSKVEVPIDENS